MKTFKTFFEDERMEIVPQAGMPFEAFMETLEGWTIQKILDRSTYINLYIGNKYGIGNDATGAAGATQEFSDKLVRFVNQDIMKFRPRVYETDEFKKTNNILLICILFLYFVDFKNTLLSWSQFCSSNGPDVHIYL